MAEIGNASKSVQGDVSRREHVARRALELQGQMRRVMAGRGAEVADALDWSESTLSRFKSGEGQTGLTFEELCRLLAALDLRLVSGSDAALDEEEIKALAVSAERGMRAIREDLKR